jgi:hypothetical protein
MLKLASMGRKRSWSRTEKLTAGGLLVAIVGAGITLLTVPEARRALHLEKAPPPTAATPAEPVKPAVPLENEPNPRQQAKPSTVGKKNVTGNNVAGNGNVVGPITQGPCSNLQLGGSNNQAYVNCSPEWHFSDVQQIRWSEFAATLPSQCAEIVVIGDIPDKGSHDFALDMFKILDEHHKVNRFGHLLSGNFGEGVAVQVHDEDDINVSTAKLIVSGMQNAGIPVVELSANPNIRNHEIHIIVAYKPSK